jgi:signal transduction histidine kinase
MAGRQCIAWRRGAFTMKFETFDTIGSAAAAHNVWFDGHDLDVDAAQRGCSCLSQENCPRGHPATGHQTQRGTVLLVGGNEDCACLVGRCLEDLGDRAFRWLPQLEEAICLLREVPIELILCDLPPNGQGLAYVERLRQAGGDVPIVVLSAGIRQDFLQRLQEHGVIDHLGKAQISAAALQRILGHATEQFRLKEQIEASRRRERLRGQILARIAENAPLRDVLADLGQALRQEVACQDCGFAIELDIASGEALLWPDGGDSAAQLANSALAYARLHPGPNEQRPECQACVSSIRIGGRLLGELAMVPGPAAAKREMLQAYAALGAELAALAIDRLQAAESLRQSQEELRQLSAQLMSIQEAERQRIAGDLHDVIGQSLSVVKVSIEEAEQQFLDNGAPEVAAVLSRLVPWVKTALGEVRRISMDLRPATIDDLGILPTLSWFFREFGASCRNIAVVPRIAIAEAEIPEALKIVIFRVLQEAFSNVVKHAQATRIQVVLQKVGGHIQLAVIDNGRGFELAEPGCAGTRKSGLGLSSMRERARVSGGSYTLESTPGVGTSILISWPLTA